MFILDLKKTKKEGRKKCDLVLFFVATKFTNSNYFIFEMLKIISKNFIELFIPKIVKTLKI
jgi:hypothetical protein